MIDETTGTNWTAVSGSAAGDESTATGTAGERVGYCQDCGRPLTRETVRPVGPAVFCEPCLGGRLGMPGAGTPGATAEAAAYGAAQGQPIGSDPAVGGSVPPGGATPPYGYTNPGTGYAAAPGPVPIQPPPSGPSPALAGLLGLIPGVGAMYNGQFAKGVVHLVIFAVFISLANNVSDVFGLFVAGWTFYQAFEAYHTAKAKRDGLPLPDPFGFNDIGDRMGFGKNWPGSATRPAAPAWSDWRPGTPAAAYTPPQNAVPAAQTSGTAPAATAGESWSGYFSPANIAGVPPTGTTAPWEASGPVSEAGAVPTAWNQVPYADTFASASPFNVAPVPPGRRFPTGAFWLIGLGVLVLISNVAPELRLSGRWLLPILLAGLSVWTFSRKWTLLRIPQGFAGSGPAICSLRWPVMLMVLAVLFSLQAAHAATLGQSWPVLLVALGVLLLLERTAGNAAPAVEGPVPTAPGSFHVTPVPDADAAVSATESETTKAGL